MFIQHHSINATCFRDTENHKKQYSMDLGASRDGHIKRPLNSFMVWAKEQRRLMNRNNPRMRNAEISKILGEEWRKMPEAEKKPYVEEALRLRRQHKVEHPNYRYRPRRKNRLEVGSEGVTNPQRLTAFSLYSSALSSPKLITPAVSKGAHLYPRLPSDSPSFSLDLYPKPSALAPFPVRALGVPSWHGFLSPAGPPPPFYTPYMPRLAPDTALSGASFCFAKTPATQDEASQHTTRARGGPSCNEGPKYFPFEIKLW